MKVGYRIPLVAIVVFYGAVSIAGELVDTHPVQSSEYGPGVITRVGNESTEKRKFYIGAGLTKSCIDNPSWHAHLVSDPRFGKFATAEIEPGSWFVKWSLFSGADKGCTVQVDTTPEGAKQASVSMLLPIKFVKPEVLPYTKGRFDVKVVVVADGSSAPAEPVGSSLQMQILVVNLTSDVRVVAILSRSLECGNTARYDWVLGPGQAPADIGAGPVTLGAKNWAAFSQRVRGTGDPQVCAYEFEVGELTSSNRALSIPPHEDPPRWTRVEIVKGDARPTVWAQYAR